MDEQTDSTVLDAARAGDARALEMLLERHQAQVYRIGLKMCRDPEDAKDVLQDTLLAMARSVRLAPPAICHVPLPTGLTEGDGGSDAPCQ